jgi:putative Holliday junction resolvase
MSSIIALDVGEKRIGVARAGIEARLPEPLTTLENNSTIWQKLQTLCAEQAVHGVIIGLPRGLDGQETAQTRYARQFGIEAKQQLGLAIHFQDEAVTSKKAKHELSERGKDFSKGDIDALAATYILEDFLQNERSEV